MAAVFRPLPITPYEFSGLPFPPVMRYKFFWYYEFALLGAYSYGMTEKYISMLLDIPEEDVLEDMFVAAKILRSSTPFLLWTGGEALHYLPFPTTSPGSFLERVKWRAKLTENPFGIPEKHMAKCIPRNLLGVPELVSLMMRGRHKKRFSNFEYVDHPEEI